MDFRNLVKQWFVDDQRATELLFATNRAIEIAIEDSEAVVVARLCAANSHDSAA